MENVEEIRETGIYKGPEEKRRHLISGMEYKIMIATYKERIWVTAQYTEDPLDRVRLAYNDMRKFLEDWAFPIDEHDGLLNFDKYSWKQTSMISHSAIEAAYRKLVAETNEDLFPNNADEARAYQLAREAKEVCKKVLCELTPLMKKIHYKEMFIPKRK